MPDFDTDQISHIIEEAKIAEIQLQEVVNTTSIDFLSVSTRAFMDKSIIVSVIGIFVSVFGISDGKTTLGPFVFIIKANWAAPTIMIVVIIFYGLSLLLMSRIDQRRWDALYALKITRVNALIQQTTKLMEHLIEEFRQFGQNIADRSLSGEFRDEYTGADDDPLDGVPKVLRDMSVIVNDRVEGIAAFNKSVAKIGIALKRQAKTQMLLFVAAPLVIAIMSLGFCIWALFGLV